MGHVSVSTPQSEGPEGKQFVAYMAQIAAGRERVGYCRGGYWRAGVPGLLEGLLLRLSTRAYDVRGAF